MCDLHHRKLMYAGRDKEKENSFTDIYTLIDEEGNSGMSFPCFALICLWSNTVQLE